MHLYELTRTSPCLTMRHQMAKKTPRAHGGQAACARGERRRVGGLSAAVPPHVCVSVPSSDCVELSRR